MIKTLIETTNWFLEDFEKILKDTIGQKRKKKGMNKKK